jgi:predicted ferric reductase
VTLSLRGLARCALWLGLYVLLVLFPVPWISALHGEGAGFVPQLGAILGSVALSILAMQTVLTARFSLLAPPFGSDVLYAFHRGMSAVAALFAVLHPLLLLGYPAALLFLAPWQAKVAAGAGAVALWLLVLLLATSLGRRLFRIPYVPWRALHGVLSVALICLLLFHATSSAWATHDPVSLVCLCAWMLTWVGLLGWLRIGKPVALLRRPYRVTGVRAEHGGAVTLVLDPDNHDGLRFRAGQFAWLTLGRSPFLGEEHPFSFSGSAQRTPRLELTVKAVGAFTRSVQSVKPGALAYVDGPVGATCIDRFPDADRYFFVVGGIGVAPCVSMLRTLADRGDRRPHTLVYGTADWDSAAFREELAELASRIDLKVVHVLERPPLGWLGETGLVGLELLERHLPRSGRRVCFVCGPSPLMDAAERALADLGVPVEDIHAERLELE